MNRVAKIAESVIKMHLAPGDEEVILEFFRENEKPRDGEVEDLAKELNLEPERLREVVYQILNDLINKEV